MLQHTHSEWQRPERVVILGSRGFLGRTLDTYLGKEGIATVPIASSDLDLGDLASSEALAKRLGSGDAVVMFSALTPDKGRDLATFMRNLVMAQTVCRALEKTPVAHVVYVSSDAVYPLDVALVNEGANAAPKDLYGTMHKSREVMFQSTVKGPLAILRSTLVYGAADTHNSYGPNRFRREAKKDGKITLGGNGEETRDHVFVEDAAALIGLCLGHRSSGVLNLASGRSISAYDVAQLVAGQFERPVTVQCTPRQSPITYRSFDVTACHRAFPNFRFLPLEDGIARVHREMMATG
jgi:UDP-glucose 4-epimerase